MAEFFKTPQVILQGAKPENYCSELSGVLKIYKSKAQKELQSTPA